MPRLGKAKRGSSREKVEFIESNKNLSTQTFLLKLIGMTRSTLNYNLKNDTSSKYDEKLLNSIKKLSNLFPEWGYRQIKDQLEDYFGIFVNENTVRRYRVKLGISAVFFPKKSQIYAKHNPTHDCSNKIRNAVITNSNQQWNIDITYFILRKNVKSYLFVIRDAFNGRIVNYKYSLKFDMNLVLDTVENSLNLNIPDNLVIHSDHGSQFISNAFDKLLKVYNVTKSMSSLGSPNENQLIEGLFGKLKNTIKERKSKLSFTNMRLKIENWIYRYNFIDVIRNSSTRHRDNFYVSPIYFYYRVE